MEKRTTSEAISPSYDYGDYTVGQSPKALADLDSMIEHALELKHRGAQRQYEEMAGELIPEHMFAIQLREHTTPNGIRVELVWSPKVTVKGRRREELHRWLRDQGHAETHSAISAPFVTKSERRAAEAKHLGNLAQDLLSSGKCIELDLLGLTRPHFARIREF